MDNACLMLLVAVTFIANDVDGRSSLCSPCKRCKPCVPCEPCKPQTFEEFIKQNDKKKVDGKLDVNEVATFVKRRIFDFKTAFMHSDVDGDGGLSPPELRYFLIEKPMYFHNVSKILLENYCDCKYYFDEMED